VIDPKPGDEGRRVRYFDRRTGRSELGFISSWSGDYVFVRYSAGSTAAATYRHNLEWANDAPRWQRAPSRKPMFSTTRWA
jgi:hypothetical protein